jgi:hypothetical protein
VKATELQQPEGLGERREGLAGTGGHLHQRTVEPLLGQRLLDPAAARVLRN